ncbi:MAG: hypothetical protein GY810_05830 [Aureispira sp.]|nr:hypothetical protein [Aureispira sp.]
MQIKLAIKPQFGLIYSYYFRQNLFRNGILYIIAATMVGIGLFSLLETPFFLTIVCSITAVFLLRSLILLWPTLYYLRLYQNSYDLIFTADDIVLQIYETPPSTEARGWDWLQKATWQNGMLSIVTHQKKHITTSISDLSTVEQTQLKEWLIQHNKL